MQIDWITVSAQAVNFLVLIWLLKRFLYGPIVRAMDGREQRIAERLGEAAKREHEAEEAAARYRDERAELERRRAEILAEAAKEAEAQKRRMLDEARADVDEARTSWQRQADQEKREFLSRLRREAAEAVESIARRALRDLADAELEERIVHVFIERLKGLDKGARKLLADTGEPLRIASAFELDSAVRGRVTRAVHEHLADGIAVDYARAPELLCGIELVSGGRRLGFHLAEYMDALGARIEAAFSPLASAGEGG